MRTIRWPVRDITIYIFFLLKLSRDKFKLSRDNSELSRDKFELSRVNHNYNKILKSTDFQMLFLVPAVIYGTSCPAYLDSASYCCHLGHLRTYQGPSCKYFSVYSAFQQRFPLNMYNLKGYAWPGETVYNWHVKKLVQVLLLLLLLLLFIYRKGLSSLAD